MNNHLWSWFNEISSGDWRVDLVTLSGLLIALGVVVRMGVLPVVRTVWRALIAAPILATRVGQLVELLETDIQKRIEDIEMNSIKTLGRLGEHDAVHSGHTARLDAHDIRLGSLESVIKILEQNVMKSNE